MSISRDRFISGFSYARSRRSFSRVISWTAVSLLVALAPSTAVGFPTYVPAFNAKYPSAAGSRISPVSGGDYTVNCAVCHSSTAVSTYKAAFSNAYTAVGRNEATTAGQETNMRQALTNIESLDSDGDGVTNIVEINARFFPGNAADTPSPLPSAPTGVVAGAGSQAATVAFTAPTIISSSAIIGYTVTASPGSITATGSGSPIVVAGLTNGTAYTFTVKATNSNGCGSF